MTRGNSVGGGVSDYNALTNKPTLGTAAAQNIGAFATATQGAKADAAMPAALQPIGLLPAAFLLSGAAAEPLGLLVAGTNSNDAVLDYADGSELNAFFKIPSRRAGQYMGGNIKVDIDLMLTGTLTNTAT